MDDEPHVEISVFTLAPADAALRPADRPALPAMFGGYRPVEQDLMVTATLDDAVVGTGGAWLYEHDAQPRLMWVRAAEVNGPLTGTPLVRTMIDALLQTGKQMGVAQAYIEPALRQHLARPG